jgi:hypothetical protein
MLTLKPIHYFVLNVLFALLLLGYAHAATVSLSPDKGIEGTLAIVRGSAFSPNDRVDITWLSDSGFLTQVAESVPTDGNGNFTVPIVAPKNAPINQPSSILVFKKNGPIIGSTSFTVTDKEPTGCLDAYFIGMHGTAEGPDGPNQILSQVIGETWENFHDLATKAGKNVRGYAIDYPAPVWTVATHAVIANVAIGKAALGNRFNKIRESCVLPKLPSVVLVGYSLGAWVINEWLSAPETQVFWWLIEAVELYGDPLWSRFGPAFPAAQPQHYKGLVRHAHDLDLLPTGVIIPPFYDNNPQGPGGDLSARWQSRCLVGDPVCGEDYVGWDALVKQINDIAHCNDNKDSPCEHQKYHVGEDDETKNFQYHPATKLTTNGANFLFLKTFPDVFPTDRQRIANIETSVEGVHVYFRLYYTDLHNEVNGFGFVGADGSGWREENHPFSSPSFGRVSPGRVDYPFNHLCGQPGEYESVVEAWLNHCTGSGCTRVSPGRKIRMKCDAPEEVITPFFDR